MSMNSSKKSAKARNIVVSACCDFGEINEHPNKAFNSEEKKLGSATHRAGYSESEGTVFRNPRRLKGQQLVIKVKPIKKKRKANQ